MEYNFFYQQTDFYFGEQPSPAMVKYITKYNMLPCLTVDIGAGEGRNSFYLARKGFDVIAIEPSILGVNKMIDYAQKENLNLSVKNIEFSEEIEGIEDVGFFVASTVLNQMSIQEIKDTIKGIYSKLKKTGYVFVSVFTEEDPGFLKQDKKNISECGTTIKYYFKKNELSKLFSNFEILEYKEEQFVDDSHGKPHYHGIAILFARK